MAIEEELGQIKKNKGLDAVFWFELITRHFKENGATSQIHCFVRTYGIFWAFNNVY